MRRSSGLVRKSQEEIQAFKRTDFPLPVAPAIKTWGILEIEAATGWPETSSPNGTSNGSLLEAKTGEESMVFSVTISGRLLGISIPTRLRPGIGASILTWPVEAAKARAKSLERAVIRDSLVPRVMSIAYWVTAGPKLTSATRALIPNESRGVSMVEAL